MAKIAEINFSESCCGEHAFIAEHIREDGVGFDLKRDPGTGLYRIKIYEPDGRTLRSEHDGVDETTADILLNS